jgi:hypothetical protein
MKDERMSSEWSDSSEEVIKPRKRSKIDESIEDVQTIKTLKKEETPKDKIEP